jgi:hypothetical protein
MSDYIKNDHPFLKIYKGNCFTKKYIKKYQKIIAFDLDETLGSFADLNILWCGLQKITKKSVSEQNNFNKIFDLYPEFIRYGILNILEYLYMKKKLGDCDKIYIYTNNNCHPPWVSLITNYFNYKLNITEDIFDKSICAFKINNKVLELSRTTQEKTYNDFIKCTLLPKTTEICFVDNSYYKNMENEKVYYIQPLEYYHNVTIKSIIERFIYSAISNQYNDFFDSKKALEEYLYDWFDTNRIDTDTPTKNVPLDIFIAQKIMYHIKEFFYLTNRKNKTKKNRVRLTKTTRKKYPDYILHKSM